MISQRFLISIALCCCLSLDDSSGKPLIDGLIPCKKTDRNINECLLDVLNRIKAQLLHGVPELDLPSLDPLHLSAVTVHEIRQDIKITGDLYNLTAKGADSMAIKALTVDFDKIAWDMTVTIPLITFVTDFNLNITLKSLYVPIRGNGRCHGNISHSVVRLHANTVVKDGKWTLNDVKVNLHFGDADVRIVNSKTPEIAQTASQFFMTNKRQVLNMIKPVAEDTVRKMIVWYGNRILSAMDVTDLFVD